MSLAFGSKLVFANQEGGFSIFQVQTLKCAYRVLVEEPDGNCRIQGPGVDEEINLADYVGARKAPALSTEAQAILAVLIFEESD